MSRDLTIKRIDENEFGDLRAEWNHLLSLSASDNFFLRWEWIHTWWTVFKAGRTLFILTARQNDRLLGIAPFYIERLTVFPQIRIVKFCSDELSPDYMDAIVERGNEIPVLKAFWDFLRRKKPRWDALRLTNMLKESVVAQNAALFGNWKVRKDRLPNCPYVKIETSYDEYVRKKREAGRHELREVANHERRLFAEHAVNHVIVKEARFLSKSMQDLFRLHEARAMAKGIQSDFLSEKARHFHCQLSALLLSEHLLDLHFLYEGDTPVSANYGFKYKNKIYGYQQGMDPARSQWKVGTVLHHLIVKQAFAESLTEVDFLKGEERYKYFWANASREEVTLTVYRDTVYGRLLQNLPKLKGLIKNLSKSVSSKIPGRS